MQKNVPEILFISWAPYCSRSENIARELGGKSYMVYYEFLGSNYFTILLKYLAQTIASLVILLRDRPDVVFVMSPPIIACVPALIYCKLFGKQYIIDAHTGSFLNPRWKKLIFLHRFFSKKATLTIVTNSFLVNTIRSWSATPFVIKDVPITYLQSNHDSRKYNDADIMLVNTFAIDEPIEEFLKAIIGLPYKVVITGKITSKSRQIVQNAPNGVTFTDFLSNNDYASVLKSTKFVMTLTTQENQMQRGVYEAVYNGIPAITSNKKFLREVFYKGVYFVNNESDDIRNGIIEAMNNYDKLQKEVQLLKEEKLGDWYKTKRNLLDIIQSGSNNSTRKVYDE